MVWSFTVVLRAHTYGKQLSEISIGHRFGNVAMVAVIDDNDKDITRITHHAVNVVHIFVDILFDMEI